MKLLALVFASSRSPIEEQAPPEGSATTDVYKPKPTLLQRIKNLIVPHGPRVWRLRFGLGRGLTMVLDLQHWTGLYLGLYEVELNRHLRLFCRRGYRCFDVGGQNGYYALVLAKLSEADIVTFECEPSLCQVMERSIECNPTLRGSVSTRCAFVTDETDPSRATVALDDVAYSMGGFVPDLIKIDIEGAELGALRGAKRILAERRPNLIIEVHSRELKEKCARQLEAAGYEPKVVSPRRWLRDNRPAEYNRWLLAEGRPGEETSGE